MLMATYGTLSTTAGGSTWCVCGGGCSTLAVAHVGGAAMHGGCPAHDTLTMVADGSTW